MLLSLLDPEGRSLEESSKPFIPDTDLRHLPPLSPTPPPKGCKESGPVPGFGPSGGSLRIGSPAVPWRPPCAPSLPSAGHLAQDSACMGESLEILLSPALSSLIYATERVGGPGTCPKVNNCPFLSFQGPHIFGCCYETMRPCNPSVIPVVPSCCLDAG